MDQTAILIIAAVVWVAGIAPAAYISGRMDWTEDEVAAGIVAALWPMAIVYFVFAVILIYGLQLIGQPLKWLYEKGQSDRDAYHR